MMFSEGIHHDCAKRDIWRYGEGIERERERERERETSFDRIVRALYSFAREKRDSSR